MAGEIRAAPVRWRPQPGPQHAFVESDVFEVVYGGARGGGKTDAALGDFALHAEDFGAAAKGLLVRRTRTALEPTIERARRIFRAFGATWGEQKSRFTWASGAVLYFRHLDRDADADLYQGHDYSRVYVEELTQFADERPVAKLKATLRSAAGAPVGFRATCNPGGPGHGWVKARYIDAGAWNIVEDAGLARVFIPARVADNPRLLANDPLYIARLKQSGSAELVRAWLEGDWNIVEGAFFDKWSNANIVPAFTIPTLWTRFVAMDWGTAHPFSVGWWTVVSDPYPLADGRVLPRGALVRYREWYGSNGKPNEGLRLTAAEVAARLVEMERGETLAYRVADPSIFANHGGPTIGETFGKITGRWGPADNTRIGRVGALSGWDQLRARIVGHDGVPMLYVFDACRDFIRTVPVLQHDPARMEDLDTDGEDHVADEARYACLSRPMTAKNPVAPNNPPDLGYGRKPAVNNWKAM